MSIQLMTKTEARIQEKIDSGAYASPDQVVEAGLRLLDEHEQRLAWLKAELKIGEEQERRGELIDYTPELLDQLSREAEENASRGKPISDAVTPYRP